MTLTEMKALYVKAQQAYYNADKPIMTDVKFDNLEDTIRKIDPTWAKLKKTGIKIANKKTEVSLEHYMPSLNKAYPKDFDKWVAKNASLTGKYIIMDKLDGSSLQVTYSLGEPIRVVTRGDGELGGDISFLIPHLNLPKIKATNRFVFRCEALMKKRVFAKKWAKQFDNARNMVAGLLNRKEPHPGLADIDIVVLGLFDHQIVSSLAIFGDNLQGLKAVKNVVISSNVNSFELTHLLAFRKASSEYEMDGLVVAPETFKMVYKNSDRPKGIIAFKVNTDEESVKATVQKIIWQVSGRGRIIPKIYVEPVRIGGVMVKHAAAHNAKWMIERKIGPGAVVKLVRSGGVIPKIEDVVRPGELQLPEVPYKEDGVHFVVSNATDKTQDGIDAKNLVKFVKTLGIDFLAEKTIVKALQFLPSPMDYLARWNKKTLTSTLFRAGIGAAMSKKIVGEFDRVFSSPVNMRTMMVASQIFGVGIGDRKLKMVEDHGMSMDDLTMLSSKKAHQVLIGVPGFSDISAKLVATKLDAIRDFLDTASKYISFDGSLPKKAAASKKAGKLSGQLVSFTSYRDKAHEAAVEAAGGQVVPFGSKTTILIYKDGGKASSKVSTAADKGVRVCTFGALGL